ncbi:hypothetical protein Tco_0893703 [Tanacetum coccineum]|uniref:Uncharacterized protein n=1 Tax=Tanacetum coccineum TaxID=301880 RepID=A0ABQ5C9L2_9ASTR
MQKIVGFSLQSDFRRIYNYQQQPQYFSKHQEQNVDTTPRLQNDNQIDSLGIRGHKICGARETVGYDRKPKRVRDSSVSTRKRCCCVNKIRKVFNFKQSNADWLADHGCRIDKQEVGCTLQLHGKDSRVETGDSKCIPDSPDMCDNDIQNDQHDVDCDDERVALANLKLDVDDNKKIQKQLKKANATLTQELTECKSILAETSRTWRI